MSHTHSDPYRPPAWRLALFSGAKLCPVCGQAIEVSRAYRQLVGLAGLLGLGFAVAYTMLLRSYWPVCVALCLVLLSQYLVARFAPMATVSHREQVRRKWAGLGFLGLLLTLFALGYFSGTF